ncbi:MAG: hypothetical protein ACJAYU_000354 [Bradymonadia bacterium]|jgi:hypothetical protein
MRTGDNFEDLLQRVRAGIDHLRAGRVGGTSVHIPELSAGDEWTRERLAHFLDRLYMDLLAEDHASGATDRDSGTFLFHDSGLAALRDHLRGGKAENRFAMWSVGLGLVLCGIFAWGYWLVAMSWSHSYLSAEFQLRERLVQWGGVGCIVLGSLMLRRTKNRQ